MPYQVKNNGFGFHEDLKSYEKPYEPMVNRTRVINNNYVDVSLPPYPNGVCIYTKYITPS